MFALPPCLAQVVPTLEDDVYGFPQGVGVLKNDPEGGLRAVHALALLRPYPLAKEGAVEGEAKGAGKGGGQLCQSLLQGLVPAPKGNVFHPVTAQRKE